MLHEILAVGPLQCNCSIFGDEASGDAFVIDPGDDIADIERVLADHKLRVAKILFTHAHLDHIGQAGKLKRSTGAPTYLHPLEKRQLAALDAQALWMGMPTPEGVEIDHWMNEGDVLELGGVEFRVRFTPGHSPGSVSFWIPSRKQIVGGDVLFRESVGRTDFPGGDQATLFQTIRDEFLTLDDDVEVVPGHGPVTTIGHERRWNGFLRHLAAS